MTHPSKRGWAGALGAAALAAGLVGLGAAVGQPVASVHLPVGYVATAPQFNAAPLPPGVPAQVRHGRDLAVIGDCIACHTPQGRPPYSGGRGLNTPFGVIYSANLTGDAQTGVGAWTPDQFWRAMHEGKGVHGENLYPAFPYPWFTKASRADSDALLAYFKTVPAVNATPPANRLPFPLNIRLAVSGWNALFFKPAAWTPEPNRGADWNRGAYIVESLGHCGACHTPKTLLGADRKGAAFQGGLLDDWYAPDLTPNVHYGLGGWSQAEVVAYLKTGRNAHAQATGAMGEVVSDSTSWMSDGDLAAVAVYLKSLPASGEAAVAAPDAKAMKAGGAIYFDACTGCHREGAGGEPGWFPPLKGSSSLQSPDPNNAIRVILEGARTSPTPTHPTPLSMPSFAWKLSDEQIADVATYVRNSGGNRAAGVDPGAVSKLRRKLNPQGPRELR